MKNIVFYHHHINGDCFASRIIVKHIIDNLKSTVDYYYTSYKSCNSHCLDIGIIEKNFNCFPIPNEANSSLVYFSNDTLYVNVWMGYSSSRSCALCLDQYITHYNTLIDMINCLVTNINLPLIVNNTTPTVPFDYSFFNCGFFDEYINKVKNVFSKVILIYNNHTPTYHNLRVNHNIYIDLLSEKYPNYFFLTFNETNIQRDNVTTMRNVYSNYDKLPLNYGIEFSYLTILCDKVIYIPSGLCTLGFHNERTNIKNKYVILFCICNEQTGRYVCDEYIDEYLCLSKRNIFIKKLWVYNIDLISEIDTFINLPLINNE